MGEKAELDLGVVGREQSVTLGGDEGAHPSSTLYLSRDPVATDCVMYDDLLDEARAAGNEKKMRPVLKEFRASHNHMAIVVDEYGGVAGVVTLEYIIEEIFGEIQDEYDENEELLYQIQEDGSYLFRGRVDLDDFNDLMNTNLPVDEADTLGGAGIS